MSLPRYIRWRDDTIIVDDDDTVLVFASRVAFLEYHDDRGDIWRERVPKNWVAV